MTSVAVQSPHSEKLSFDQGGVFMRETRRDVEQYLSRRRTRTSGALQLYAKTAVAFALTLAAWLGLVVARPGLGLGLVCLAGLVLGSIITALCVQHDANHGAYFRTRRANHLMGWTADALLGFSSYTWRVKHNVAHHTYTNVEGYDDDIDQTPFLRLAPAQEPKRVVAGDVDHLVRELERRAGRRSARSRSRPERSTRTTRTPRMSGES